MRAPFSRTMFELLDEQAARHGMAVICGDETSSYAELAERARQGATVLASHGVKRGDRVGMLVNNRTEWLEIAFGAWLLGAVPTPFSTWSTKAELEFLLGDSAVSIVVCVAQFGREDYAAIFSDIATVPVLTLDAWSQARAAAALHAFVAPGEGASAGDDAIILYTSGSTSRPKAIALAHYLVVENGFNIGERQGLGPTDRVLLSPPLFWTYGGVNALPATLTHGATLVLQGRFDAGEALDLIERHRCTSIYTLPGMTSAIIGHPDFKRERTRSLRVGMTIGSPQDVINAAEVMGAAGMCNVYGSSETGGNCCVTHHDWPLERRANCQGLPLPGVMLRIVDESSGTPLGPNQPGLVEVKGPYVMHGYTASSAVHNASVFTPDGWFQSGDIGQLTDAGEMVFLGRSTEMIKRAGINVSPAEVEDVLLQHPDVAQVGVVGTPSDQGESIVAFVVPKGAAQPTAADLAKHCRNLASSYKTPDRFEIVGTLPTTVTGKVMRKELKVAASHLPPMPA